MNDSRVNPDSYILVQGWMINELKLKGNELLIFAIIHGFSQDNAGEFTGGLQYLMDWTNSTKKTVIAALKELVSKKLIEKKEIELNGVKYCSYRCKFYNRVVENLHQGGVKTTPRGGVKTTPNILSTDNIDNNLYKYIVEIVDYLNKISGKNYSPKTASTQKHIIARLNEGRTIEDFKKVIDNKCAQWLGTNMEMYIRPETLFAPTKFENYLNETVGGDGNASNRRIDPDLFGRHA